LWFKPSVFQNAWGIVDAVQHLIYADKDNFPQGSFSARIFRKNQGKQSLVDIVDQDSKWTTLRRRRSTMLNPSLQAGVASSP
jgi:hypothetical protein